MTRLATGFWVSAYLRRLGLEGIGAYVLARGDDTAGVVRVKVARGDGQADLWERQYDLTADRLSWVLAQSAPEAEIDARLVRERARDRDAWAIEVEARDGDPRLQAEGL